MSPQIPTGSDAEFEAWFGEFRHHLETAAVKLRRNLLETSMRRDAGHPPVPLQLTGEEAAAIAVFLDSVSEVSTRS